MGLQPVGEDEEDEEDGAFVVAVSEPSVEALLDPRVSGQLDVYCDMLLGAASAVEGLVGPGASAELTLLVDQLEQCTNQLRGEGEDGPRKSQSGEEIVFHAARRVSSLAEAREARLARRSRLESSAGARAPKTPKATTKWTALRASVAKDKARKKARLGLSDVVDPHGKVTASPEQLERLLRMRTVRAAKPPMSDAVGKQLLLRLKLIDMRWGKFNNERVKRAFSTRGGPRPPSPPPLLCVL